MGVNEDKLSAHEHADMRDLVLAGSQKIRPAGSRRGPLLAGAAALVLVGAVAGGAVTAGTIIGGAQTAQPSPTPTEQPSPTTTPTPTPTPSPTTPTVPPEGIRPFGGACSNALRDDEVAALRDNGLAPSQYRWLSGAEEVLGGIDCLWLSNDIYLDAEVHLYAYPDAVVPDAVKDASASGCTPLEWDETRVSCTVAGLVEGTRLFVVAIGRGDEITAPEVEALYTTAAARLGDYAVAVAAERTAEWWSIPDCESLAGAVDPAAFGYEAVAELDMGDVPSTPSTGPESISDRAGTISRCSLHFTAGSGDSSRGEVVDVMAVPGGGAYFASAEHADHARPAAVEGARAAVWVPGLNRFEGSPEVLVVTDGTNNLLVSSQGASEPTEPGALERLAAVLLGLMR